MKLIQTSIYFNLRRFAPEVHLSFRFTSIEIYTNKRTSGAYRINWRTEIVPGPCFWPAYYGQPDHFSSSPRYT